MWRFWNQPETPGRRGSGARVVAWLVAAIAASAGCDSGSYIPSRPPELDQIGKSPSATSGVASSTIGVPGSVASAPTVELILAGGSTPERLVWETVARQEAGGARALFGLSRPGVEGTPAAQQLALIRRAADRGVTAMVVEALDDPEVSKELNDVRARGVTVVTLGRKVASRDPAAPLASVVYPPIDETARALVAALLKEAESDGLSKESHALIVVNEASGPYTAGMVEAMTSALKSSGVVEVATLPFTGDYQVGLKALKLRIESDPKLALLLAVEDQGMTAVQQAQGELKTTRRFSIVGATTVDKGTNTAAVTTCAAIVDLNLPTFGRRAVALAMKLARGEPVKSLDVVVPQPLHARVGSASSADAGLSPATLRPAEVIEGPSIRPEPRGPGPGREE